MGVRRSCCNGSKPQKGPHQEKIKPPCTPKHTKKGPPHGENLFMIYLGVRGASDISCPPPLAAAHDTYTDSFIYNLWDDTLCNFYSRYLQVVH